jgi:2-hydroxy-6-oxo-octa-2,4-dienoate hydrolase
MHPAIGKTIMAAGFKTNYHETGTGRPVVLLHGSGVGVTGWENWHRVMPRLADGFRVLCPDIVGFGFTERPEGAQYSIKLWTQHLLGFLDALNLTKAVLVGNSFGGGLSLALAMRNAHRIAGMVLMGTPAGEFVQTAHSARSWYYEPSVDTMAELLRSFPYDPNIVTEDMVRSRYEATKLVGGLEAYRKLFPEPAKAGEQKTVKGVPEAELVKIETPILALHGREDRVIPFECGLRIARRCPNAELHLFGRCGHWVQIEREDQFVVQTRAFLDRLPAQGGTWA